MQTTDSAELSHDVLRISRIGCVPAVLRILREATGMGFAAIARVTDSEWTACAVDDHIGIGLLPGSRLDLDTTLCKEARLARRAIVIDRASTDPVYRDHITPRTYRIESYISVPIIARDGNYFGNLCAVDRKPADVSNQKIVTLFERFAELIASELQDQQEQEDQRIVMRGEREISRLREQFIAVLGHDLRNPLSAIAVSAAMLKRNSDPQVAMVATRLTANVQRMAGLIDDTLDFARGRLGTGLDVRLEPVTDLAVRLGAIIDECRDANPRALIESRIASLPVVRCDARRMQQLLSNLLGNALKHGDNTQPVRVDIDVVDARLSIVVANRGNPIAEEERYKLFEPFWRKPQEVPSDGLGLGLFICAQIVKAHGGGIDVLSSAEAGTRFSATLPTGVVETDDATRRSPTARGAEPSSGMSA